MVVGRPIANISVLVSFLLAENREDAIGAVTVTNFHDGAKLPVVVM